MGICGTGVGALAAMLKEAGYQVSGSDQAVYPPMSDFLAGQGIAIHDGYDGANLEPRPDLVVVGNVIRAVNPEAIALAHAGIPYLSMPQILAHCFIRDRLSLVVAGTHGKTTTSSVLATLLNDAGRDPGFLIGGLVMAFGRNYNLGQGDCFVVEGDEYDTAFFDKVPKFLHYRPHTVILTSVEFDHADIYADLAAVKKSFMQLVSIIPPEGKLIANLDDPVVQEITELAQCPVEGYGLAEGRDWRLVEVQVGLTGTEFLVHHRGLDFGRFRSIMPGVHNALNSLAVIAVLDGLGVGKDDIRRGLTGFGGIKRRQEVRGVVDGITVIDDFAHHPTAVRETLVALRAAYPGRLVAVFEPRTNSSRRRIFQDAFAGCFDAADLVVVREPEPLVGIAEEERFSARRLVADLSGQGVKACYFPDTDDILSYLFETSRSGDIIAILSNGGFDQIHQRLLDGLQVRG
ncbi:MAG: UDP-N-acetylmuramate:L-alanyl-gamma-D-glutamyl-meso-diaminopimelate ligase [Proteobacteria bacterium]|nr:UDP-N-acetylmuramate:L-alanyl-gamma-D-glutamyl-meso-diaminopimelate ligase [Pseudomonadota bacterium]MBU1685997.1 UDP-N-acetylmuramate:L-alanyl-gamma-D-glutamyl-meso-diaminopimelate ligase [Pseudomonadota bacterium]